MTTRSEEEKFTPHRNDVVREVFLGGTFSRLPSDERIEGPWSFLRASACIRPVAGRGVRYEVTVVLRTHTGSGTVRFSSTQWPGIIDMKDAFCREWYVQPQLAGAVAEYARAFIDDCIHHPTDPLLF